MSQSDPTTHVLQMLVHREFSDEQLKPKLLAMLQHGSYEECRDVMRALISSRRRELFRWAIRASELNLDESDDEGETLIGECIFGCVWGRSEKQRHIEGAQSHEEFMNFCESLVVLLEEGANPNSPTGSLRMPPLMRCIRLDLLAPAAVLLIYGARPDAIYDGHTLREAATSHKRNWFVALASQMPLRKEKNY